MSKTQQIEWIEMENGTSVGTFPTEKTMYDDYICPRCGKVTRFAEGQIDETPTGNAIYGWWFACWDCMIESEAVEGRWNGDDS